MYVMGEPGGSQIHVAISNSRLLWAELVNWHGTFKNGLGEFVWQSMEKDSGFENRLFHVATVHLVHYWHLAKATEHCDPTALNKWPPELGLKKNI